MTSTSSTPTDWLQQLYQTTNLPAVTTTAGRVSDSTVVSTTSSHTAGTNPPSSSTTNYSFAHHHLGNLTAAAPAAATNSMISSDSRPARSISSTTSTGRGVSKPARRRSRASRKNPTTLLSTDTKNFRAMVQRFTGGGIATASGDHAGAVPSGASYSNIMPFMYQHPHGLSFPQQAGGTIGGGRGGSGSGSGSFMMSMGTHFADHTLGGHQMMIPQQQYMFSSSSSGPGSSTSDTSPAVPSRGALIPTLSSQQPHNMDPHDQSAVVTDPSLVRLTQLDPPDGRPRYPSTPNSSGRWR